MTHQHLEILLKDDGVLLIKEPNSMLVLSNAGFVKNGIWDAQLQRFMAYMPYSVFYVDHHECQWLPCEVASLKPNYFLYIYIYIYIFFCFA